MKGISMLNLELYKLAFEIESIGNEAVNKAKEENKEKGLPSIVSHNGKIMYELPDGSISLELPEILK